MAMDDHSHSPSPWLPPNCFMGVGVQQQEDAAELEADDYLKQALVRTTLELESTRLVAQEELKKLEAQSLHLAHLLQIATRERDEARHNCHSLLLLLSSSRANPNPSPGPNLEESSNTASSSEEEEEESSKLTSPPPPPPPARERGLPERGRLVEAVMRAGPLLQTLLLAGPLPQWRHPPPAVQSFEIPPVSISVSPTNGEKKRKREDPQQQQQSPPPPPNLNVNSSSLDSNASTKVHHNHHHHNNLQQQFGSLRA